MSTRRGGVSGARSWMRVARPATRVHRTGASVRNYRAAPILPSAGNNRRSEIVRAKDNVLIIAVRDGEGR